MVGTISTLSSLVNRLDSRELSSSNVIRWASPVPSFGDVTQARVATLGLNPSNREFVDESGHELEGAARRFHTLTSLGLSSWVDADARHLGQILESCAQYFSGNPYDRWFRTLDTVMAGLDASYYGTASQLACHLDLIPYATEQKWTNLTSKQRSSLLESSGDALASLLRDSEIDIVILNGQTVVSHFCEAFGTSLDRRKMRSWALPRASSEDVAGFAYSGVVGELAGIELGRELIVVGFNHNLQSSYGVTAKTLRLIRDWLTDIVPTMVTDGPK